MTKIRSKGTALQQQIASGYTPVAQIISIDLPEFEAQTYESDTLDNTDAAIPYSSTGRTEPGSLSFELFFDPAHTGHQAVLSLLEDPDNITDENWKIVFADTDTTEWTFTAAGISFGGTVALNDGLKASVTMKLASLPAEFAALGQD